MEKVGMKTRKEIASELSISISTFNRWIQRENIDLPKGRYINPAEYKAILSHFGVANES